LLRPSKQLTIANQDLRYFILPAELPAGEPDSMRVCLLIRFSASFSASFEPEALAVRSPFGP
jgi:hypothetical protein